LRATGAAVVMVVIERSPSIGSNYGQQQLCQLPLVDIRCIGRISG
jgi:hypothetical protein